jgi:4-hydroxybenzoate polyprenyltransferase
MEIVIGATSLEFGSKPQTARLPKAELPFRVQRKTRRNDLDSGSTTRALRECGQAGCGCCTQQLGRPLGSPVSAALSAAWPVNRPVGIWLLLFPCWWSQALAQLTRGEPYPNLQLLAFFAVGAAAMRAAGCAYNDFVDRNIDGKVQRTAARPIPSGQISPAGAVLFIVLCALAGFAVLLRMNTYTIILACSSLLLVLVYPFAKRVMSYPQLILGLAFKWGALVGWAAIKGSLAWPPIALYVGCVLWTIGYDTIYAHQDAEDDATLGLGSTALLFGENTVSYVGALYGTAVILWLIAGALSGAHLIYFLAVTLVFLQMAWQVSTLDIKDQANCLRRFRSNRDVGFAIFLGLVADMALSWFAGSG